MIVYHVRLAEFKLAYYEVIFGPIVGLPYERIVTVFSKLSEPQP